MYKYLNTIKSTERNKIQGDLIKGALTNFKDKNKQMPEDEIEIEKPYEIVDILEKIF